MGMKFEEYQIVHGIDLKQGWVATNAHKPVKINKNTKDKYELWVDGDYKAQYDTFDIATRYAEAQVSFHTPYQNPVKPDTVELTAWDVAALEHSVNVAIEAGSIHRESGEALLKKFKGAFGVTLKYS